jgi:multiple sugar transport system permease protein
MNTSWSGLARGGAALDSALAWADDRFDRSRRLGDAPLAAFLLAPSLLVLGVFGIAPMAAAVYMSLYGGKRGMGPMVGLDNYREALSSPAFWKSFSVTVYYVLGTIPVTMALSFFIAYALSRILRGRAFFRVIYFLPYVTSAVAAAMVWRSLFNAQSGVFNLLLGYAGVEPQQWLLEPRGVLHLLSGGRIPVAAGPSLALCCIILFDIWHGSGFMVVVFLAGLTSIPRELEEAARIDGAGPWHVIRNITLPLLSPTIFFLAIVGTIRAFQAFNSFYALTQGGGRTLGTTENLILHIYSNFYEYGFWGYGAAVATLLSLAIVVLTVAQWRLAAGRVHYT